MGLDVAVALLGLIAPPVVDFVKKKFLKRSEDTPEATMSSLATTKPEVLPGYVAAISEYMKTQIAFFNRDVVGTPSQWVVDLRSAIRPIGVIGAGSCLIGMVIAGFGGYEPPPSMLETLTGVRLSSEIIISSWFGDRITLGK